MTLLEWLFCPLSEDELKEKMKIMTDEEIEEKYKIGIIRVKPVKGEK